MILSAGDISRIARVEDIANTNISQRNLRLVATNGIQTYTLLIPAIHTDGQK
jgi:hypothetical protein